MSGRWHPLEGKGDKEGQGSQKGGASTVSVMLAFLVFFFLWKEKKQIYSIMLSFLKNKTKNLTKCKHLILSNKYMGVSYSALYSWCIYIS